MLCPLQLDIYKAALDILLSPRRLVTWHGPSHEHASGVVHPCPVTSKHCNILLGNVMVAHVQCKWYIWGQGQAGSRGAGSCVTGGPDSCHLPLLHYCLFCRSYLWTHEGFPDQLTKNPLSFSSQIAWLNMLVVVKNVLLQVSSTM